MDPITHTTLGATLGYALLGRQLGRKSLLYAAIAANIPDLDILAYPFLQPLDRLEWHRGISHSLFLHAIISPPLAWIIKKIHPNLGLSPLSLLHTTLTIFLVLSTHALLDACTTYGTQLLSPILNSRIAWNIIFTIDPIFTLPLILTTVIIGGRFFKKLNHTTLAHSTIALCALYLILLAFIKQHIHSRLTHARQNQGITTNPTVQTAPAFPGPFLWRQISKAPEGCYIAYASLLDSPNHRITHALLPFPLPLQQRWQHHPTIRRFQSFSQNHGYLSQTPDGHLIYHDTRFGEIRIAPHSPPTLQNTSIPFSWLLIPNPDGTIKILRQPLQGNPLSMITTLWQRLLGNPVL
jgi:inner membrane protein